MLEHGDIISTLKQTGQVSGWSHGDIISTLKQTGQVSGWSYGDIVSMVNKWNTSLLQTPP